MKQKKSLLKILRSLIVSFCIVFLGSCTGYKQLPYLKNAETIPPEVLSSAAAIHEAQIMPHDIITITVNSNIPGAATDFNLPIVPANLSSVIQTTATYSSAAGSLQNYLVDKDGKINFPILGQLSIGGT